MAKLQPLDFEKSLIEMEDRLEALRQRPEDDEDARAEAEALEAELQAKREEVYAGLRPWQRIQIARHIARPRALDYVGMIIDEWTEIKGDRGFRDDPSVVCGLGRIDGRPLAVIGQQKGKDTRENVARNFGMMHPEGYRKALRTLRLAERFSMPVLILIDTPGAYPGVGAEERGQAEAIARNIMEMFDVRTPIVGCIIGEGASGGALGIGVVDTMLMMENSWYCVISPEGCASILWRDAAKAPEVSEALKLTADDLIPMGVVDEKLPEPQGGAHYDPAAAAATLRQAVLKHFKRLGRLKPETLLQKRFEKYRALGVYEEQQA